MDSSHIRPFVGVERDDLDGVGDVEAVRGEDGVGRPVRTAPSVNRRIVCRCEDVAST